MGADGLNTALAAVAASACLEPCIVLISAAIFVGAEVCEIDPFAREVVIVAKNFVGKNSSEMIFTDLCNLHKWSTRAAHLRFLLRMQYIGT